MPKLFSITLELCKLHLKPPLGFHKAGLRVPFGKQPVAEGGELPCDIVAKLAPELGHILGHITPHADLHVVLVHKRHAPDLVLDVLHRQGNCGLDKAEPVVLHIKGRGKQLHEHSFLFHMEFPGDLFHLQPGLFVGHEFLQDRVVIFFLPSKGTELCLQIRFHAVQMHIKPLPNLLSVSLPQVILNNPFCLLEAQGITISCSLYVRHVVELLVLIITVVAVEQPEHGDRLADELGEVLDKLQHLGGTPGKVHTA